MKTVGMTSVGMTSVAIARYQDRLPGQVTEGTYDINNP